MLLMFRILVIWWWLWLFRCSSISVWFRGGSVWIVVFSCCSVCWCLVGILLLVVNVVLFSIVWWCWCSCWWCNCEMVMFNVIWYS